MPQVEEDKKTMESAGKIRAGGKVRPREDVEIFSTGKGKGGHLGAKGKKHVVHAVLAHKLIENGHATSNAPKIDKPEKPEDVKLTAAEVKALEKRLGHQASDDELAVALAAKQEGGEA